MVIQRLIGFKDCTVYGVEVCPFPIIMSLSLQFFTENLFLMSQVGNLEGRAGMVAIVDPKHEVDLDALAEGLDKNLSSYARPLFLRILSEIPLTGIA